MSKASSLPYHTRPNKSVDRELFISLLNRLNGTLDIENYQYIGMGGPFMEDFRLIHSKVGIRSMVCIETDPETHKRQVFNRPFPDVKCINAKIEEYLSQKSFDNPTIIWLDYTTPKERHHQISLFASQIAELPLNSVLRITLNANPQSLGEPKPQKDEDVPTAEEKQSWRLEKLREQLGSYFPYQATPEDITKKKFGRLLLKSLELAVSEELKYSMDRKVFWAFSTHYADGQPMVTATAILLDPSDTKIPEIIKKWEFHTDLHDPHILDMPVLSAYERLTLEYDRKLDYSIPPSGIGNNPIEIFKKFYRVYPHFSKVDI